jgi:hypothetical protein
MPFVVREIRVPPDRSALPSVDGPQVSRDASGQGSRRDLSPCVRVRVVGAPLSSHSHRPSLQEPQWTASDYEGRTRKCE